MLLLNRYEYSPQDDLIGKSNFARVYRSIDKKMSRKVALKIYKISKLTEEFGITGDVHKDLELDHPNIIRYYDTEEIEREDAFGETELLKVRIMEFFEEGNLTSFYAKNPDPKVLNKLLCDTLRGIVYLNRNGLIHGNLKPSNILIKNTYDGPLAKITDMGLSKTSSKSFKSSSPGFVVSPLYMAPEQLNSGLFGKNIEIGTNIDIWGFGVSVYEVLTGECLFMENPADSPEQIIANIISFNAMEKLDKLPPFYRNILTPCLIRDAALRLKNIDELIMLLETPYPQLEQLENKIRPEITISLIEDDNKTNSDSADIIAKNNSSEESTLSDIKSDNIIAQESLSNEDQPEENSKIIISEEVSSIETPVLVELQDINETTFFVKPTVINETEQVTELQDSSPINDDTVVLKVNDEKKQALTLKEENVSPKRQDNVRLFNRYEYHPADDMIGKGGFSRVYRAYDKKLERWVALKIYKGNEMLERYSPVAEIRRVINLDHPNICRYLDIEEIEKYNALGELEKIQVCVMELLDGGNLNEYYNSVKDLVVLKKLVNDILKGIAFLHLKNIIHRDIKPANILIKVTNEGPVAKITDFGISKGMDSANTSSTSALIVSIPFMAPEQINGKKYGIEGGISSNLDLWTFGVSLYEVITGKVLFKENEQDTSEQIMSNIMAPELPDRIYELPSPFREIVEKCLVKDAKLRVQRAEELIRILNANVKPAYPSITEIEIPESSFQVSSSDTKAGQKKTSETILKESPEKIKKDEVLSNHKEELKQSIKENAPPATLAFKKKSIFMDEAKAAIPSSTVKNDIQKTIPFKSKIPMLPIFLGVLFISSLITIFFLLKRNDNNDSKVILPTLPRITPNINPSDTFANPVIETKKIEVPKVETTKNSNHQSIDEKNSPIKDVESKKTKNEVTKNESSSNVINQTGNSFSIKIFSNRDCSIELNNEVWGEVRTGRFKLIKPDPGVYTFVAYDLKTKEIIYKEVFELREGQLRIIRIN